MLPGWLLMAAAPFNGLLALAAFVSLAQVAPSPLLLAGMLLWLAAPLAYLTLRRRLHPPHRHPPTSCAAPDEFRPSPECWPSGRRAACSTMPAPGKRSGSGWSASKRRRRYFRPWHVVRYLLDFAGRALFVTVLGADLLLRATLSAWRYQREFEASPAAAEFDGQMERMEATGKARLE